MPNDDKDLFSKLVSQHYWPTSLSGLQSECLKNATGKSCLDIVDLFSLQILGSCFIDRASSASSKGKNDQTGKTATKSDVNVIEYRRCSVIGTTIQITGPGIFILFYFFLGKIQQPITSPIAVMRSVHKFQT